MSLELHIETRGDKRPDPEVDPIRAVVFTVFDDVPVHKGPRNFTGMIVLDKDSWEVVTGRLKLDSQLTPGKSQHLLSKNGTSQCNSLRLSQSAYIPLDFTAPSTSAVAGRPSPPPSKGKGKGKGKRSPSPSTKCKVPAQRRKLDGGDRTLFEKCGVTDLEVIYVQDEADLMQALLGVVAR